jgi:formate dehydrogenase subunit gamma
MSTLTEAPIQENEAGIPAAVQAAVQKALAQHAHRPGPLMPVLHDIQHELGYAPKEAVPLLSKALHLSRAEIHGVITYYPHFRQTVPAAHQLHVCRAEACQAMGVNQLIAALPGSVGCGLNEHRADGRLDVEAVYCLGQCAVGPAVMLDGRLHARMTTERLKQLVQAATGEAQ